MSLFADDVTSALLLSKGQGVLVNGSPAPASLSIFPGDTIQIPKDALARLQLTGSAANLGSESEAVFDVDELSLDRGSVSIYTTKGLRVRVRCITITPVDPSSETLYEVTDSDGKVTVHATKNDVYIDRQSKNAHEIRNPSKSGRDIVREGEQKSREEHCPAPISAHAAAAGIKPILNNPWAVGTAGVGIGGVIIWVFLNPDDPVSPSKP